MTAAILWFRQNLRLSDNPALQAALRHGDSVLPVFIWNPESEALGGASRWWLHHSLAALDRALQARGSQLHIALGSPESIIPTLAAEIGATHVFYARRYEPSARAEEQAVQAALSHAGLTGQASRGNVFFEPGTVLNKSGKPFQVFTPFWKHCLTFLTSTPLAPAPTRLTLPKNTPQGLPLAQLALLPRIPWDAGLATAWQPGEAGAQRALDQFTTDALAHYGTGRDLPGESGVSRISPHLHFGEISPQQIFQAVSQKLATLPPGSTAANSAQTYLKEVVWREFAYHLLYHFPHTPNTPLREEFKAFPWREDPVGRRAWEQGQTGYPIVDAGMRELWATGWMHNRVRMIVGSFLTKDLLISWQAGAHWFWDTLVDADLASNTLGWQWTAGCGADASPFFRVFNPVLQAEKFDPKGAYVRRWVPELAQLPDSWIHKPWQAPPLLLHQAGVSLGHSYPAPIIDHGEARERALAVFKALRRETKKA